MVPQQIIKNNSEKIGNCISNKEIIALKRFTMKTYKEEKLLITNFFGKQ